MSRRAFTIIEMVIVLAVLGLVVGITAPRFIGASVNAQARDAARGLVDTLTAQRAETIRSMKPKRLFLLSDTSETPSIRLLDAIEDEATAALLESLLAERGKIDEPFAPLGVWEGVAGEHDASQRSRSIRGLTIEPTGRMRLDRGEDGFALVVPNAGGTIWWIGFDPISGIPSISRRDGKPG